MSWHCLRELVEEYSLGGNWDGGPSARLKKNPTLGKYCSDASAMDGFIRSLSGTMSAPSTDDRGEGESMSSVEVSHARTLAQQEKEQELPESGADSGGTWRELSVRFAPDTCSWKTAHSLFPEDLDWSSLTLPRWGMLQSGELWEQTTQALLTEGKGAGLWPTPCLPGNGGSHGKAKMQEMLWRTPLSSDATHGGPNQRDSKGGASLTKQAHTFPTPTADDANNATRDSGTFQSLTRTVKNWPTPCSRDHQPNGGKQGSKVDLGNVVKNWPTPTRRDYKDTPGSSAHGVNPDGSERDRTDRLPMLVYQDQPTGTLSPDWVELLMGWPMGWTSMEPLTELRVPTVDQWQDGTWELGVPRVGVKIPDRVNRLKAIGNGQVPQAAVMAWEILSQLQP